MRKKGTEACGKSQHPPAIMPLSMDSISVDPFGSYTGVSEEAWEKPVQDADDL